MKRVAGVAFILLLSGTCGLSQPVYQADLSGIDAFYTLLPMLKNDPGPSEEQWRAFRQTGGYRFIDFDNKELKRRLTIAFSPSEATQRDSILAMTSFNFDTHTVSHLIDVDRRWEEIQSFREETDFKKLLMDAHHRVKKFLPERVDTDSSVPPLYFAFYQPDAASQDSVIIADLLTAMTLGTETFTNLVAHEMHHYYRKRHNPLLSGESIYEYGGNEYQVIRTIAKLQSEGTADLIDKKHPAVPGETIYSQLLSPSFLEDYRSSFYATPTTLRQLDSMLIVAARAPGYVDSPMYQLLSMGGHPSGFYMALLIREELGIKPLIDEFDNPVAFIRIYNEAVKQRGGDEHIFSPAALEYLSTIEKQYFRK